MHITRDGKCVRVHICIYVGILDIYICMYVYIHMCSYVSEDWVCYLVSRACSYTRFGYMCPDKPLWQELVKFSTAATQKDEYKKKVRKTITKQSQDVTSQQLSNPVTQHLWLFPVSYLTPNTVHQQIQGKRPPSCDGPAA